MKALSIKQPWASLVAAGFKTVEVRTWSTSHRGPLLVCASAGDLDLGEGRIAPGGKALAVVNLVDVRPMAEADIEKAHLGKLHKKDRENALRSLAWIFTDAQEIIPVPVKGKQGLFNLEIDIKPLPADVVALAKENDTLPHIEYYSRLKS